MFTKANPKQAALKLSIYGPPGSGKTFTTLLMAEGLARASGKRVAYVDTERGTDFYAKTVEERSVHPEAFDFDALYTQSLASVLEAVQGIDPQSHGVVVIDSISHLWDAAMGAYTGKKTSQDGIPMHAWGTIKKPYKDLVRLLMDAPYHVFILGRQKNLFETDERDQMRKVGVAMRAEGETAYEPHICLRMEGKQDENDSRRSIILLHVEKDRSGILAGRTFPSPSFSTIEPLLALLGDEQAQSEDEDERIAADSELHIRQQDKAKAKADKSRNLFTDLQAEIQRAGDIAALGEAAKTIKKQRRYLLEEHTNTLRVLFGARREQLVNETAPEVA